MKHLDVERILSRLLSKYQIYAPVNKAGKIKVSKISLASEVDWSGELPTNSFKSIFLPPKEVLFDIKDDKYQEVLDNKKKTIAWGVNILDLQAFTLMEQIFEKDVYYQKRRQNIFVVGFTNGLPDDFRKYKVFHQKYEESVLEHVRFDVFIERQKDDNCIFFSGSEKGQKLLEGLGVKKFQNIEFAGLIGPEGMNPRLKNNRETVALSEDDKLWDELADICLACGKCSVVCPTCYCFALADEPSQDKIVRTRREGNCFYSDFSKVVGGAKELDSVKKRLYFWYYHKFVRIPDEASYYGCVSCMRCFKVCPVGINIAKNLQTLTKK